MGRRQVSNSTCSACGVVFFGYKGPVCGTCKEMLTREYQIHRYKQFVLATMEVLPRFGIPLPDGEKPYLERFILEAKPDGSKTYLHFIYASDGDRDPHDHPFDFESTIIHGSYVEQSYERYCAPCNTKFLGDEMKCRDCGEPLAAIPEYGPRTYKTGQQNYKRAHQLHRITSIEGPVVVTLVKRSPKIREWGFATTSGWMHHKKYIAENFPNAQPTEVD